MKQKHNNTNINAPIAVRCIPSPRFYLFILEYDWTSDRID